MAHDVFVSHSSKDKPTADAVCAMLESQGIRCWVAPRDILPGMDWGEAIVEAVKGARVMVLVFSASANDSPQIKREVERAVNHGIPVIPLRIEDVAPKASLEYFISTPHWLDAFTPPLETHLQYLAQVVRQILGIVQGTQPPITPPVSPTAGAKPKIPALETTQPAKPKSSRIPFLAGLLFVGIILLAVGFAAWWFMVEKPGRAKNPLRTETERSSPGKIPGQGVAPAEEPRKTAETLIVPDHFATIQSAINSAKAGDTVEVKAGIYSESLRFIEGLHLAGEGKDLVRVRSSSTNNALNCDGIKKGFVSGLTFEHADKSNNPGSRNAVVSLGDGSSVEITDCRVQMGDGTGIVITNGSPKILECIVQENGRNGIVVLGSSAHPTIIHNQCRANQQDGIHFTQGASGEVRNNVCENNGRMGILAGGSQTAPTLDANQCRGNELDGIRFGDGASGRIQENICEKNKGSGISVYGVGSNAQLIANICRTNANFGIWCETNSHPVLGANQATGNIKDQIVTDGRTAKLP